MRSKLILAALLLPAFASALDPNESIEDSMLKSHSKPKQYDRDLLKSEVTETMEMVDALAAQAALAKADELAEVWLSGPRDFKISESLAGHAREATLLLVRAQANESTGQKADELRDQARAELREQHKTSHEEVIRDLRNWLSVSEGSLRRANEARVTPVATPAPTAVPTLNKTPQPLPASLKKMRRAARRVKAQPTAVP